MFLSHMHRPSSYRRHMRSPSDLTNIISALTTSSPSPPGTTSGSSMLASTSCPYQSPVPRLLPLLQQPYPRMLQSAQCLAYSSHSARCQRPRSPSIPSTTPFPLAPHHITLYSSLNM